MNDAAAEAPPTGQPVGQGVQAILSGIAAKLAARGPRRVIASR